MTSSRLSLFTLNALCLTALAACGGGGGNDAGTAATGTLKVALTDAPACGVDHVWVTVTKVRLHQSATVGDADAGWTELAVDPAAGGRRIDLLSLQNGLMSDLGQVSLPAGRYNQVRLVLASQSEMPRANEIVLSDSGETIALQTPSAQQSGLKIKHAFDVEAGTSTDLVLDFDACRSIVRAGGSGRFNLKPVLTAMPKVFGTITGSVVGAQPADVDVSLQSYDTATGAVKVLRATAPRADGTWTLAPVPVSTTDTRYNLVVAAKGYRTVVYTGVPVASATPTAVATINLLSTPVRTISGQAMPPAADDAVWVRALQRVVDLPGTADDITVQTAGMNADAVTGDYSLNATTTAAQVAAFAGTLSDGANAGLYTVEASTAQATDRADVDVTTANVVLDLAP